MERSNWYILDPAVAEKGDRQDRAINGELIHDFAMPEIECSCVRRGGGFPATSVPVTVPSSWRKRPELCVDSDLMRIAEFREWRASFLKALTAEDASMKSLSEDALRPGMPLHPIQFKSQSRQAGICHPIGGWVVRRDVSQTIEKAGLTGIRFAPAVTPKSGSSEYDVPHVSGVSGAPEGVERAICQVCGSFIDDTVRREWRLRTDRLQDADFQILATTSMVLVSERVRTVLGARTDLNSVFRELEVT